MSALVVASVKGAPEVTGTCVSLAAAWPKFRSATVLECDPSGGDLATRFRLPPVPSIVDFAAGTSLTTVVRNVAVDGATVSCVTAPTEPRDATTAVTALARHGLSDGGRDLIVDVGRLVDGGSAWPLVCGADVVLVTVTGTAESLAHLTSWLTYLHQDGAGPVCVAVTGDVGASTVSQVLSTTSATVPAVVVNLPDRRRSWLRRSSSAAAWATLADQLVRLVTTTDVLSGGTR